MIAQYFTQNFNCQLINSKVLYLSFKFYQKKKNKNKKKVFLNKILRSVWIGFLKKPK